MPLLYSLLVAEDFHASQERHTNVAAIAYNPLPLYPGSSMELAVSTIPLFRYPCIIIVFDYSKKRSLTPTLTVVLYNLDTPQDESQAGE